MPGGAAIALLSGAVTGSLTGLVAGKPIWAGGAKLEGGIKAFFGALMGVGAMYALRRWGVPVPAPAALGGAAPIGELPAVAIPVVAAVLGAVFGLDNSPADAASKGDSRGGGARKRVAASPGAKDAAASDEGDGAEAELGPRRAGR